MSKACPWGIPHHDGIDCVYCERAALRAENERLWALLRAVAQCGVESADERVRYVTVQIDRDTWAAVQEEARRV